MGKVMAYGTWPALFKALVVLYRMLPIFTKYETFNVWVNVFTIIQLLRMFPPTDCLSEKRIGLVSMKLLYIAFTYYTQHNEHDCFRLRHRFSLRCSGPWMNHLPPVRWSNFRFMFLNESWCVSFTLLLYWCLVFIFVFTHCQILLLLFLSNGFTLK